MKRSFKFCLCILSLFVISFSAYAAGPNNNSQIGSKPSAKSTLKQAPLWGTLLHNELKELKNKKSVKPILSLAKNPLCQIDPFRERLLHRYGKRMLQGDIQGAGEQIARFAAYQRCISRAGMRDWEEALSRFYTELFKKNAQTRKDGVKATFNIALMIFDYLNYTGYSALQQNIKNNLSKFQEALPETDTLF
ncbi:MAG: hypothetical protein Q7T11_08910 [Deltaproteobacteria bacterium]|nr:hypothetical protein [Deltaproteobacteria bacterium]